MPEHSGKPEHLAARLTSWIRKAMCLKNPKISGTTHNVFGIQTGVAVMFLLKNSGEK